ncbi:hypothetical protein [Campylobacter troglodytis]|uniref:hypothetical protein n=1 Tax=Campylobacter troglodytis TaxID=654363 RepID=UPI00163B9AD8|nr:hypothetical protein [Campylobacter troglodytis]
MPDSNLHSQGLGKFYGIFEFKSTMSLCILAAKDRFHILALNFNFLRLNMLGVNFSYQF